MEMNLTRLREIEKDREASRAAVHGVARSWIQLSDWTHTHTIKSAFYSWGNWGQMGKVSPGHAVSHCQARILDLGLRTPKPLPLDSASWHSAGGWRSKAWSFWVELKSDTRIRIWARPTWALVLTFPKSEFCLCSASEPREASWAVTEQQNHFQLC